MDRQEGRRPEQVVVDPALVEWGDPGHGRALSPMAAVEGHRLGALDQLHPAALPRSVGGEIAAEVVRGELVELGVDARAVVALAVVLGDELPVGLDLVGHLVSDLEAPEVEALQVGLEIAQPGRELRRRRVEAHEDEPLPRGQTDGDETGGRQAEVFEVLGVLGPDELAVEVVDPGVVRALEPDGRATALLDHGSTAMLADVVEAAQDAVPAPDDEQRLVVDRRQEIGRRLRCVRVAPDDDPVAPEPAFALEIVDRLVVVGATREQRRSPVGLAHGCDLLGGERRRERLGSGQGSNLRCGLDRV